MLTLTFRRSMPEWQKLSAAGQPFMDVSPRIKVERGVEVHQLRLPFAGTVAEIATFDQRLGSLAVAGRGVEFVSAAG